jgi:hypothetical protein
MGQSQSGKYSVRPYLRNAQHNGYVETIPGKGGGLGKENDGGGEFNYDIL